MWRPTKQNNKRTVTMTKTYRKKARITLIYWRFFCKNPIDIINISMRKCHNAFRGKIIYNKNIISFTYLCIFHVLLPCQESMMSVWWMMVSKCCWWLSSSFLFRFYCIRRVYTLLQSKNQSLTTVAVLFFLYVVIQNEQTLKNRERRKGRLCSVKVNVKYLKKFFQIVILKRHTEGFVACW